MTTNGQDFDGPILECRNLCLSYFTRAGEIPAVIDFNLTLKQGESVGLVGESGCGKSTVAMAIMQYMGKNGGVVGGEIFYKGRNLADYGEEELRQLRGNEISMVYQEPMASLNPSMTLGTQLMEVPLYHEDVTEKEAYERAARMLADVNLPDPERVMATSPPTGRDPRGSPAGRPDGTSFAWALVLAPLPAASCSTRPAGRSRGG